MNLNRNLVTAAAIALSFVPAVAQSDPQAVAIARMLSGQRLLVTFRDGGPVYGTYTFVTVEFCGSGRYISQTETHKETVMGNDQSSRWLDSGMWDISSFQGQPVLRYVSQSGKRDILPIRILPDGTIFVRDGVTVVRRGPAQFCR